MPADPFFDEFKEHLNFIVYGAAVGGRELRQIDGDLEVSRCWRVGSFDYLESRLPSIERKTYVRHGSYSPAAADRSPVTELDAVP
jgi:hypothetical protein